MTLGQDGGAPSPETTATKTARRCPCPLPQARTRYLRGQREVHARSAAGQQGQPDSSSNQVTVRPATLPPAPPRRHARHHLKPATAFRIAASWAQFRRPRPAPIGDLDPDHAAPALTVTVTVAPDWLYRTLLPKSSLTSRAASSPHGCPGPRTPPTKVRATRARSARPASVTPSRTVAPAISAPALLRPLHPREAAGPLGGHTRMHARLSGARQAGTCRQPGPSVAVREKPTVTPTARPARTPSAICPWTPLHSALQRYKVTHDGTRRKTARIAENSQLAGRFPRVWQVLGSNQRRLSRRFYSPLAPPESPPADLHLRRSRRDSGLPPSAMRPWAADSGAVRAHGRRRNGPRTRTGRTTDEVGTGHGRGRKNPRTGPVGAVSLTASTRIPTLTWHFRRPARCRRHLRHRGLARHPGCRGLRRCAGWRRWPGRRRDQAAAAGAMPSPGPSSSRSTRPDRAVAHLPPAQEQT
jgi:hypothetical protein